jgi:hypothetical protein
VALVRAVAGAVVVKSSAVSISILPPLAGRDAEPSSPSGLPVVKKNCAAVAAELASNAAAHATTVRAFLFIYFSRIAQARQNGELYASSMPHL